MRLVGAILFVVAHLALTCGIGLAKDDLEYKRRGNRHEGLRSHPVSGYQLELISVVLDHPLEFGTTLPRNLTVEFHIPDSTLTSPDAIRLTVRESNYDLYYWLDQARPDSTWSVGRNRFTWSTADVLQKLNSSQIRNLLHELAVLIQLGPVTGPIRTTPALLYGPEPPGTPKACLFTLRPNSGCTLDMSISSAAGGAPLHKEIGRRCDAESAVDFLWPLTNVPAGKYVLQVTGRVSRTGAPIALTAWCELPEAFVTHAK